MRCLHRARDLRKKWFQAKRFPVSGKRVTKPPQRPDRPKEECLSKTHAMRKGFGTSRRSPTNGLPDNVVSIMEDIRKQMQKPQEKRGNRDLSRCSDWSGFGDRRVSTKPGDSLGEGL